jgi:serine/threonine protein kinase
VGILQEFPKLSKAGCDLLDQLLTYDPEKRIGAARALRHPWLATEAPFPLDSAAMPHFQSVHLNPESLRAAVRNDYDGNTSHATGCVIISATISATSVVSFVVPIEPLCTVAYRDDLEQSCNHHTIICLVSRQFDIRLRGEQHDVFSTTGVSWRSDVGC